MPCREKGVQGYCAWIMILALVEMCVCFFFWGGEGRRKDLVLVVCCFLEPLPDVPSSPEAVHQILQLRSLDVIQRLIQGMRYAFGSPHFRVFACTQIACTRGLSALMGGGGGDKVRILMK